MLILSTNHLIEQLVKVGEVKALGLVHSDQLQQPMDPNLSQKIKWNILDPPQYWLRYFAAPFEPLEYVLFWLSCSTCALVLPGSDPMRARFLAMSEDSSCCLTLVWSHGSWSGVIKSSCFFV